MEVFTNVVFYSIFLNEACLYVTATPIAHNVSTKVFLRNASLSTNETELKTDVSSGNVNLIRLD